MEVAMLMSPQILTSRMIIDDAQRLRKQSRELRHKSGNIRAVSVLWKEVSEELVTALLLKVKSGSGCPVRRCGV
jgi:hypothetical protein